MDNNLFKRLKKQPKWKLRQERDELQMEQKIIRTRNAEYTSRLSACKDNQITALKANDGEAVALMDREIETLTVKIKANNERYKSNAEILEIYSKVLKNDREGKSSAVTGWVGAITGIVGAGAAVAGLKLAYNSDREGTLIGKKTLEWAKSLPLFRKFGGK